jgi:hypothetical protein
VTASVHNVVNAVLFQLSWLVCVQGDSVLACVVTASALTLHWRFFVNNAREWQLWVAALVLGVVVDTALINLGVLQLSTRCLISPPWLVCTWIMFATTMMHSLAFLTKRNLLLSAALGFVGGPLAYYTGTRFGAASLGAMSVLGETSLSRQQIALGVLAVSWALVTPLLVVAARHIDSPHQRVSRQ